MITRGYIAVVILACALTAAVPSAWTAVPDGEGVTILGAGFTGRPFALDGDVVLETNGIWNCLRDHGAPDDPGWVGWHHGGAAGAVWRDVLWEDGLAAVLRVEFSAGVQFVDFSVPSAPVTVGTLTGTTYASGLLHQRLLYLTQEQLIIVYDVANPASPAFRYATTLPAHTPPRPICATGDLVYFVETGSRIRTLDASDQFFIQDLGSFEVAADRIDGLAAAPGALYALVATETVPGVDRIELISYDLAIPSAPVETDRKILAAGPGARGLQVRRRDQLLMASENQGTTHAFDVSVPTLPAPGFTLPVAAADLVITDSRIITRGGEELRVHERTPAGGTPALLSVRHELPRLRHVSGCGPLLLAQPEKDYSLLIPVDATDPTRPHLGAEFETGLDGEFVHHGDVAVMIDGDDIQVIDVSDPGAPRLCGPLRLTSRVSGLSAVLAEGILALEADAANAVDLVDLGDLDHPIQAGRIEDAGYPFAVSHNTLLTLSDQVVTIHDVRDPTHPVDLGPLDLDGTPVAATIAGQRAYCLTAPATGYLLQTLDISNPASVQVIATRALDSAGSLSVHGQRLYVAGTARVQVIDISQPGPPAVVAWFEPTFSATRLLGTVGDLIVTGTHLSVSRDETWRPTAVSTPAAPPTSRLVSAHPNPFNPRTVVAFHLAHRAHTTITVHDLRGRRVATLASRSFSAGTHELAWTATDQANRPLPSGTYLIHLTTPTATSSLTTTLVK